MAVTDIDKGYDNLVAELGSMDQPYVLVGIRQDKGGQVELGEELTLAAIASVNEFGSEDGHVPSRPFLRFTVDSNQAEYVAELGEIIGRAVDGKATTEEGLTKLGLKAVRDVQATITTNDFKENAQATKDAKGSTSPLIDTGRLRQSIDFEVGGT